MADPTVQAWQRATPRDLLTGEPLRDETPKIKVAVVNLPSRREALTGYGPYRRTRYNKRISDELEPLAYIADAAEVDADAE